MTIAVVWQEDGFQWCAADTRVVAGPNDRPRTEIASKIFTISMATSAMTVAPMIRAAHYRTQFGFVYAGSTSSASTTAIMASTFLQDLARPGDQGNPPSFEDVSDFVRRLAERVMKERRQFVADEDAIFSAAFFGWCPHESKFKVAHIAGRSEGGFRVELSYPEPPPDEGDPWLVLGSGAAMFHETLKEYRKEAQISKMVPRRVIGKMVAAELDRTVGGSTSIGVAYQDGFRLCQIIEPITLGQSQSRRTFNGLDLDSDVGNVGKYFVAIMGLT